MTTSDLMVGKFSGFALWLVPSSSGSGATLQAAIREVSSGLRDENPGCSQEFAIHATLLAGLGDREITAEGLRDVALESINEWKSQQARQGQEGLSVGFKDVVTRGSYFQCILIALQPINPLLDLYTITKRLVDKHFPPPPPQAASSARKNQDYFPHISLLYADLTLDQAQSQINHLHTKRVYQQTPHGIALKGYTHVLFDRVEVWNCTGPPEDWTRLNSIPL